MTLETSLATDTPAAGQIETPAPEDQHTPIEGQEGEQQEGEKKPEAEAKPEKTPEQREIDRLRRGIDRRTRQLTEARIEADRLRQERLTGGEQKPDNRTQTNDSEPLTLTRAQLAEMVKSEAEKLAPTLQQQSAEVAKKQGVIQSLEKNWGKDRFDEISSELDEAFGGLTDRSGRPKPAIDAVFEADDPAKVIEYLADPDHIDEAERIAGLGPIAAGKAIAKLEARIATERAEAKPKPSNVPAPLQKVRAQGAVNGAPDPGDTKAWIRWSNEQEFRKR